MELNEDEIEVANEEESRQNSAGRRREQFKKHKSESENALGGKTGSTTSVMGSQPTWCIT